MIRTEVDIAYASSPVLGPLPGWQRSVRLSHAKHRRIGFLLLPGFSLLGLASALDPLRIANRLCGQRLYDWVVCSWTGAPVHASNGVPLAVEHGADALTGAELILLCGEADTGLSAADGLPAWLRAQARRGAHLGAIGGAPWALAGAGVLNGYRCTIHWEYLPDLYTAFPRLTISRRRFEVDRDRLTAGGGTASMGLMIAMIAYDHHPSLANAVSEVLICDDHTGDAEQPQHIPLRQQHGRNHPQLVTAVSLMEANISEPLPPTDLAACCGLSLRQLERLFKRFLDTLPCTYYRNLRLQHGRRLLRQTLMPVSAVADACGFASAAHFSRCYKSLFAVSPKFDRGASAG